MNLSFAGPAAFARAAVLADPDRVAVFADLCRINTLYMIMRAGSGHIGSSFSSLDVVSWLYLREIDADDVYFSSKGHDVPGLYAVLIALGILDWDQLHRLRQVDGLPGHPDVSTKGIVTNTGSLGMGISKAKGMVRAARLNEGSGRVFVLTGDGELQEGQIWESLQGAANLGMGEITVIVDHNKIQSDTWVEDVSDLGDLERKFASFGWAVARCEGHDFGALEKALADVRRDSRVPGVVIADTVKGRGVSFMEDGMDDRKMYRFHSGAPSLEIYESALSELTERVRAAFSRAGAADLDLECVGVPGRVAPEGQRLVAAYSSALLTAAKKDERIVALDGDLVLDTGLVPFADTFPERFFECGIAEQDMVSQAGGLALRGLLPVVHSFASFLSTRPNEQVFVNATEHTKVVYVGSLAGIVPGGPGHSHQSVRDVAALASVPGMVIAEPSHEAAVGPLLEACLHGTPGPAYLRLVTPPTDIPFDSQPQTAHVGRGSVLREGSDVAVIGAGPIVLSQAFLAAEGLGATGGPDVRVVDLPWLNVVDDEWFMSVVDGVRVVVVVENHSPHGGQGEFLLARLAQLSPASFPRCLHLAVDGVPAAGANADVLRHHGLDAESISAVIARAHAGE